jgi:phage terminase small subunit
MDNTTKETEDILEPRHMAFLEAYLNPKSDTFSNAKQSALKVGYSEATAIKIMNVGKQWLVKALEVEKGRHEIMLDKAENNLETFLESNEDIKVKADITKFVAERIGKARYSPKQEIEASIQPFKPDEKTKELIQEIVKKRKESI